MSAVHQGLWTGRDARDAGGLRANSTFLLGGRGRRGPGPMATGFQAEILTAAKKKKWLLVSSEERVGGQDREGPLGRRQMCRAGTESLYDHRTEETRATAGG